MKIHYISCHSVLEYDEVQMLTDMGHEVFSNGAYLDPAGHITLPRPAIKGAKKYADYIDLAINNPKTKLPKELIVPFDLIIVMHTPDAIAQNWDNFKHKKVIWRSIGQSTPAVENRLRPFREQGLKIIRYSPKEAILPGYIGADATIRFYKNENDLKGWVGGSGQVINFTQSLRGRGRHVHYDEIIGAMAGFDCKVYGPGNDDLGQFNGGEISYEMQKQVMQQASAYLYAGTWPAPYTLSFIEAWILGVPIVAYSKAITHIREFENLDFYEVDELIEHGVTGFLANNVAEARQFIASLLQDNQLGQSISAAGRLRAIELFGETSIKNQWQEVLSNL